VAGVSVADSTLSYQYDELGMITSKTDFNASTVSTTSTAYEYDSLNRLVKESSLIRHGFDPCGLLIRKSISRFDAQRS
jgi:YD repeat-containing protein